MLPAKILQIGDSNYPNLLKHITKPPEKLFYRGNLDHLTKTCISIVGTRKYSAYGEEMTQKIIRDLSCLDICIVSGLALGIDSIAHRTALECGLPTIAVLGNGIDYIYPAENLGLALEIEKNGLILSEYPGKFEALRTNFPQRNRIVSGLSIGTIMIEAPEKSGALITAKYALEQGREIFAVPGDIDRENSLGTLRLLQKGAAYAISSGDDVLEVLKQQPHLFRNLAKKNYLTFQRTEMERQARLKNKDQLKEKLKHSYNLSSSQEKIISQLPKHSGLDMEALCTKANLPISELLQGISVLEIKQLITTKSGKYYRNC
ncbi:DNA-protecting protein DprA [Candidatus Peregrinibacteria bacterium]|nr:DNA-protecting protein DprA [Candidatus Peregrinibacteria bacterium]